MGRAGTQRICRLSRGGTSSTCESIGKDPLCEIPVSSQKASRLSLSNAFGRRSGSPHETNKTKDPWHAAAAFRKKEDFKGSGVSLHMYPDGTVVPSKSEFPVYQATAATAAEVGQENAHWLDPEFIAAWQRTDDDAGPAGDKKGKSKAESSKGSSSKGHKSSTKHRSQGSSSKGKAVERSPYSLDPETGIWYRYTENGAVVYLDANSQREYYYDENGQAAWLD